MTPPLSPRALERCAVVAELARSLQPFYRSPEATDDQRRHVETVVGAALWYVSAGRWPGQISRAVFARFHPASGDAAPRWTEDHAFPRKVAARELLTHDWAKTPDPAAFVAEAYAARYGVVHYVTPQENKQLVAYQKASIFTTSEAAYAAAGIVLVALSPEQLRAVRRRDAALLDALLS